MINSIKNFLIHGDELLSLIVATTSIVSFLIGISVHRIRKILHNRKRRKILSAKSKKCTITIPTYDIGMFYGRLPMLILSETKLRDNVARLCRELGIDINLYASNIDITGDEIHIGGPTTNAYSSYYFHRYFENFHNQITQEHYNHYASAIETSMHKSVIRIVDDISQEGFVIDGDPPHFFQQITGEQDVALLVKLTGKDSGIGNKNVHLLCGVGGIGTRAAVNYFLDCYDELYKKHKGNHYFLAFYVSKKTAQPTSNIFDLTNEMFTSRQTLMPTDVPAPDNPAKL